MLLWRAAVIRGAPLYAGKIVNILLLLLLNVVLFLLWRFGPFSGHCLHSLLPPFLSEASFKVSKQILVLQGRVVSPTPNPQPGGPGYPFLSGSSPLTCPAREPLPVATLPQA
jgi:hypothetical protein